VRELPSRSVPNISGTPASSLRAAANFALFGLTCAIAILVVFDIVALHAWPSGCAALDNYVRRVIHSFETPLLTVGSNILTWLGSTVVLPIVVITSAATLRFCRLRHHAWFPIAAIILADLVTESAKQIVKRPRPQLWFALPSDPWSFPSGHSLNSTACYLVCGAALLLVVRRTVWRVVMMLACVALPIAIGLSRIYLGVHWPTDVLAGSLAGACIAAGLIRGLKITSLQ
jgi:undecaprenyl-diphosphatase